MAGSLCALPLQALPFADNLQPIGDNKRKPLYFEEYGGFFLHSGFYHVRIIKYTEKAVFVLDAGKRKQLLGEFLRYVVVGGVSFLVDAGVMAAVKEVFYKENCTPSQMALCVAAGFVSGLLCNYLLSSFFVFRSPEQQKDGKNFRAFLIYLLVGIIGFGLTELGMFIGVAIVGSEGLWYLLVKCFVAGVVLIWNYVGRKIFVYHGR